MRRIPTAWRRALVWAVALAAMALTASLGRWQLSRAAEKEALQAAIAERQRLPALDGASLAQALSDDQARELLHRAITLRGQWLADRTVFLDNRPMARQTGFYVLTPLRLTGGDRVVLVQRGWAPRHQVDRSLLPPVQTPTGEVQVSGRIAARPGSINSVRNRAARSGKISTWTRGVPKPVCRWPPCWWCRPAPLPMACNATGPRRLRASKNTTATPSSGSVCAR